MPRILGWSIAILICMWFWLSRESGAHMPRQATGAHVSAVSSGCDNCLIPPNRGLLYGN